MCLVCRLTVHHVELLIGLVRFPRNQAFAKEFVALHTLETMTQAQIDGQKFVDLLLMKFPELRAEIQESQGSSRVTFHPAIWGQQKTGHGIRANDAIGNTFHSILERIGP